MGKRVSNERNVKTMSEQQRCAAVLILDLLICHMHSCSRYGAALSFLWSWGFWLVDESKYFTDLISLIKKHSIYAIVVVDDCFGPIVVSDHTCTSCFSCLVSAG